MQLRYNTLTKRGARNHEVLATEREPEGQAKRSKAVRCSGRIIFIDDEGIKRQKNKRDISFDDAGFYGVEELGRFPHNYATIISQSGWHAKPLMRLFFNDDEGILDALRA